MSDTTPKFKRPDNVFDLIGADHIGDSYRVTLRDNEITIRIYDGTFRRYLNSPIGGDFLGHLIDCPVESLPGMMKAPHRVLMPFAEHVWGPVVVPALQELKASKEAANG